MVAAVILSACGADPLDVPPAAPNVSLLRNPTANIGSQADVVADDLAGVWSLRQAVAGVWPVVQTRLQFAAQGPDLVLVADGVVCAQAGACPNGTRPILYREGLAGRFRAAGPVPDNVPSEIWVYWMDFDDRTMAIGNPNGDFVAILDRMETGGGDRITAAREILDWYGYDLTRLVQVRP